MTYIKSSLSKLTIDRLKELLSYDADTGIFTRIKKVKSSADIGQKAGCSLPNGYAFIAIDGERHYVHRLAWFYFYGKWPTQHIDHIDGNPRNNRIENLRDVSVTVNMRNRKLHKTNSSGFTGVTKSGTKGKWLSFVNLGTFDTKNEAAEVHLKAKALLVDGTISRDKLKTAAQKDAETIQMLLEALKGIANIDARTTSSALAPHIARAAIEKAERTKE